MGKNSHFFRVFFSVPTLPSVRPLPSVRHSAKPLPSADTRQSWNRKKNPKKMGIFTQKKWKFFFNWWRPPPVSAHPSRHFSRKFHGHVADWIRTRDLTLCMNLLYHYTTLSLVFGFRFSSQYIILN